MMRHIQSPPTPLPKRRVAPRRAAFSLLEVILALALSILVIAGISMAIRVHLVTLERQRVELERTQVARSVLQMITQDLRAALQYKPADVTGLEELKASQEAIAALAGGLSPEGIDPSAQGDLGGIDPSALGGGAAAGGGQPQEVQPAFDTGAIADCTQQPCRPGIYGNETELLIDVSRLPRIDEYNSFVAAQTGAVSIPSDVKSIAYYVSDATNQPGMVGAQSNTNGGLYRRHLDRAVAAFAFENGGSVDHVADVRLLAPEVAEIQFRYFDGEQWVGQWDSDQMSGFPRAVEVVIIIDPARNGDPANYTYAGFDLQSMYLYRSVVHLPIAEILPEEEATSEETMSGSPAPQPTGGAEGTPSEPNQE